MLSKFSGFEFCLFTALLLASCASDKVDTTAAVQTSAAQDAYQYPIMNSYAATIIGTPAELKRQHPEVPATQERRLIVFKDRKIPEGFWYERDGLKYGELLQTTEAPLIYIIAGTGATHRSEGMRSLAEAFYLKGFHVILLPSTTHTNFIINASENFIPGRPQQSAKDLYRVMQLINQQLTATTKVSGYYLTGYSLGATDAAFTAELDSREKRLNFHKVLLINPPLSVYSSIVTIDKLLYAGLPDGINGIDKFIDTELARLATVSPTGDALDFQNARLLIDAYTKYPVGDERLATMIGLAFRLFAANMMFTSDVMAHTGYIFPPNVEFETSTSLNNYMSVALRTSLLNYFEDVYSKKYMSDTVTTNEALIAETSLESISGFLSNNPNVGLVTNKDDIILAPGELETLAGLFGNNATVFPNGGHLGNLTYPPVTQSITNFMTAGEK